MKRLLIVLALAAIIIPGVAHGLWTSRWGKSGNLQEFSDRLGRIPDSLQGWQGEDLPVNQEIIARTGLAGYLSRRYRHSISKNTVMVLVATGRPGPVCVHTPDICYQGLGYVIDQNGIRATVQDIDGGAGGAFQDATFRRPGDNDFLKIYWSWSAHGRWETPSHPRMTFGASSALYKLYVICPFAREEQQKEADEICQAFLRDFLPALQKTLF